MGAYLADWPRADLVGLWPTFAKRFTQLGGTPGPYFLQHGRQGFHHPDRPAS